ncbi:hypothetical protein [Streptomyces asiaticus]|uniref:hypothetical protein n=1 Tax=Streptomyces asiaticus TaxID=114695 RepID=UPI001BAAFFEC|nr:hypothetical protein [Streptomyces asiaticus]
MSEIFKADDVVLAGDDPTRYVVVAGPFNGAYQPFYVLRREGGTEHRTALGSTMKRPAPEFEVGGTVTVDGEFVTLLAGPFNDGAGAWWVVQDDTGSQYVGKQRYLTNYQPPAPAVETFEYDGTAYEVGATYVDREGDRVTLTRMPINARESGVLTYAVNGVASGYSFGRYVDTFGPLWKVEG